MADFTRRAEDSPSVVERVVALEVNIAHIRHTLDTHIDDESVSVKHLEDEIRANNVKHDARMTAYENSMTNVVQAIRDLTEQLRHIAPLTEAYNEVRSAFRLVDWLVKNAKTIAVIITCGYVISNAPQIVKLLGM